MIFLHSVNDLSHLMLWLDLLIVIIQVDWLYWMNYCITVTVILKLKKQNEDRNKEYDHALSFSYYLVICQI